MRMLRQRRELAGNICLVVFTAFLFTVFFTGVDMKSAEAAIQLTEAKAVKGEGEITFSVKVSPISEVNFDTIFAQLSKNGETVSTGVYKNVNGTVYEGVYFNKTVSGSVYEFVYDLVYNGAINVGDPWEIIFIIDGLSPQEFSVLVEQPPNTDSGSGGGGGGGGAVTTPPATYTPSNNTVDLGAGAQSTTTTTASGQVAVQVTVSSQEMTKAVEAVPQNGVLKIAVTQQNAAQAQVSSAGDGLVAAAQKGATLQIESAVANYSVPASVIPVAQVAQELGVQAKDVVVEIKVAKAEAAVASQINSAVQTGQQIVGEPIEFTITIKAAGTEREVKFFGSTYVPREVPVPQTVNTGNTTAVVWENGVMRPVPTIFTRDANGQLKAVIMSRTNSVYALVQTNKSFADVEKHWSKEFVNTLASKLIIEGKTKDAFAPNDQITRAEFATLLVKALGLPAGTKKANFSDISADAWYANYVGAAVEAGIVSGYSDKTFKPNANITRQDMAVMISNALAAAGKAENVSGVDSKLSKFADSANIASYAKESVAKAVQAEIIKGRSANSFAPKANATRAEGATMIKHMLVRAGLMQ